ncbi:MAG: AAA family ATPase [Candidatus Moraniibacteriota bacterium]
MIRKIRFSNFYSFEKEQEISFLTNKKKSYAYFDSKVKDSEQITKVAGFIGGNASGKTNIMRLLGFFNHFVRTERKGDNLEIAFKTFFDNEKLSNFYIEFEAENSLFFYEFKIKNNIIKTEELFEKKINKRSPKKRIFLRKNNKVESLHDEYFKDFPIEYLKTIRGDVSLISFLKAHYNIEIINKISKYFSNIYFNFNEHGRINTMPYNIKGAKSYLKNESLKLRMEDFVRKFDIGLDSFEINEIKQNNNIFAIFPYDIFGLHKINNDVQKIPFIYESRGTQSLFFMLAHMFNALENNGVVVIDELETGLHPESVKKIIDYFIDENEKGQAQLIFSSHALDFLKKFDMQQIFLVKKDNLCRSELYRLDCVEEIRSDENFLAKYNSGAYGAFPNIKV